MMQGCKDGWSRRGWIGAVLAGCVALGAAAVLGHAAPGDGAAGGATTQPATAASAAAPAATPATAAATAQPAGQPAPASQAFRPVPKGLSVVQASSLTGEERSLLNLVADGDDQWLSTGLYVLLRHAEMLPDSKATYDAAEPIDTTSFWTRPAVLRGGLVRFDGLYAGRVDPVKAGPNDWWGGKQFYTIFVKAKPDQDAIVVAVTEPPPADLRLLTKLSFAGFFYKTFQRSVSGDSGDPTDKRVYPMLVAKKAYRFNTEVSSPLGGSTGVLVAIAGGLLIFAMVRAYIRARQKQAAETKREADVEAAAEAPEVDFDIDPELGKLVEELQAEHPEENQGRQKDKGNPAP
jgi:hypothetical protein